MSAEVPVPGVGVAVLDAGNLLLVQRGREPGRGLWAVPGGKVQLGETLTAAAIREVEEETGLIVELGDVVWVGESIGPGDPPQWHFVLTDFVGAVVSGTLLAGDDAFQAKWVPLEEAGALPLTPTMYSLLERLRVR